MVNFIEFSLVMCCFIPVLLVGDSEAQQPVKCNTWKTCDQCILNFGCAWCDKPDTGLEMCQDEKEAKCSKQFLINPKSRIIEVSGNNSKNNSTSTTQTQKNTESQFINIELKPRGFKPLTVFSFCSDEGYPLQLSLTYHCAPNGSLDIALLQNVTSKCAKNSLNFTFSKAVSHQCKEMITRVTKKVYLFHEVKISCSSSTLNETNKYEDLKIGDRPKEQFQLGIELLSCPNDKSQWNQQIFIGSSGMDKTENFNLTMLCQCCEHSNQRNEISTEKQMFIDLTNPYHGDKSLMIRIDNLAKKVVNSTLAKNESIVYSSNIIYVQANMTSIVSQDKKNDGPEVTIPKNAIDQLPINTEIKIVVFKDKNLTKFWNDIVVVHINKSIQEKPDGLLRIKFERKNLKSNYSHGNWRCVSWDYESDRNKIDSAWDVRGMITILEPEFIICSSTHLSAFSILLDPLDAKNDSLHEFWLTKISIIGSWITICFLILVLVIHYQKKIEKETIKILLNSSSALLLTHASFQIYSFLSEYVHCLVINFMTHYSVLAFLLWTAADGINMWRILITDVFNTRGYVFYRWYKIISWGIPLVTSSIGVLLTDSESHLDGQKCKLKFHKTYDWIFYLVPCMSILCCNMLLFTWMLINVTCENSLRRIRDKKIDYVLALSQVFGIGWCIAFPFLCFPSTHLSGDYIFAAVISTQGLLIFVVRCGSNIKNFKKKFRRSSFRSSSMRTWLTRTSRSPTDLGSTPLHSIDHAPTLQEGIAAEAGDSVA